MRIHTLGPETTDSYMVAKGLVGKTPIGDQQKGEVVPYTSFDQLIHHIPQLKGEYLLFPLGFQSAKRNYTWKDFHYDYYQELDIVTVFPQKTKPMALVRNKFPTENRAIIHPATKIFLEKYLKHRNKQAMITFADSKAKAWSGFLKKQIAYTICSLDDYQAVDDPNLVLEETYEPEMIWCLYRVKEERE